MFNKNLSESQFVVIIIKNYLNQSVDIKTEQHFGGNGINAEY